MVAAVPLQITIDHEMIIAWAQRRGALPSTYEGDERPWPLKFNVGPIAAGMVQIRWDKFFEEFERANLAFVYRDVGPNGELDDFHEFVNRAAVPELTESGKLTIVEQAT
jgi:hypothetical protein